MRGNFLSSSSHQALITDAYPQAEKQGWEYQVDEPKVAKIPPKNYGESAGLSSSPYTTSNAQWSAFPEGAQRTCCDPRIISSSSSLPTTGNLEPC
jgi:hypothetical protein